MKGGNEVKKRKYLFSFMSALLSFGILTGCGVDDNEPDPTEEPSEQQQENNEELEEEEE